MCERFSATKIYRGRKVASRSALSDENTVTFETEEKNDLNYES
jgi:hypothetical protein